MSKRHLSFVCQNCGAATNRWQGKCDGCGEWNSIAEETAGVAAGPGLSAIGIADAHEHVGAISRGFERDELIAADPGAPMGDRRRARFGQPKRTSAFVDHDEVVPAAMHLEERHQHDGGYRHFRRRAPSARKTEKPP